MLIRLVVAVSMLVLLATCGSGPDPTSDQTQTPASTVATVEPPPTVRSTTTTVTTTTTKSSTTVTADQPRLVLRHDGLGVVSFGDSVDSVMYILTELLGPPDVDEIQIAAEVDRSVWWDNPSLYLQFTSWDYFSAATDSPRPMPEGPVFHYYLTESDLFETETGIKVGSTVGELEAAYPDLRFGKPCDDELWSFFVDPSDGWLVLPIFGLLDGDLEETATRIVHIGAGWDRTPC